jgi:L,D-transpeptidase catalytic domain
LQAAEQPSWRPPVRRLFVTVLLVPIVLAAGGFLSLQARIEARASAPYLAERARLEADLGSAAAQGYTARDLRPVTDRLNGIEATPGPLWLGSWDDFYRAQADRVAKLRTELVRQQQVVLTAADGDAARRLSAAGTGVEQDRALGAPDDDVAPLQQRLDDLAAARATGHTVPALRAVGVQAQEVQRDAATVAAAAQIENLELRSLAAELKGSTGGSLDALHKIAADTIFQGRNEASAAAYLNRPSPFRGYGGIRSAIARLERHVGQAGSDDVDQAAIAAAAGQRYSGQIHDLLMGGLPPKAILISYQAQLLRAYQDGQVLRETLVTTGRPALPTDIGPMKVVGKDSPWRMHSPWPPGSPAWYPDTVVQMVVWFTSTGEGLHDAYWQGCCWGPGSQYGSYASHGCIHVPYDAEMFLYNWTEVGLPVILYPGDGRPVAEQLAQMTTDDQGVPLRGP